MAFEAGEMELIFTCLLLALVTLLIFSVTILAMQVQKLRENVALLERPRGYSNPVNLIELRQRDSTAPRPRPISGTCSWMKKSMESVVVVPSREGSPPGSPKEVFRKEEGLLVVNTSTHETFRVPTGNNND